MSAGEVAKAQHGARNFDHLDRSGRIAGAGGGAAVLKKQAREPRSLASRMGGVGTRRW
jgi:hypothetical protein